MRMPFRPLHLALALAVTLLSPVARAQTAPTTSSNTGYDRLFLAFIEDTAIAQKQWWEGQLELADGEDVDVLLLRGIVAFQPWTNVELGGRVGFGNSDASGDVEDGTGATDVEAWGKYRFGKEAEGVQFAAGASAIVPTGDDAAGLGSDSFALAAFGTLRWQVDPVIVSLHAGLRTNGDGQIFGVELNGKTSPFVGGGVIYPLSDRVSLIGEVKFEGERFEEGDKDTRVLGGVNWRPFNRGMFRGAVASGLSDGSPNFQLIAGYAAQF